MVSIGVGVAVGSDSVGADASGFRTGPTGALINVFTAPNPSV